MKPVSRLHGGPNERERYLAVLEAGGSNYGYPVLKAAGPDVSLASSYQPLLNLFISVLDELERISV